MIRTGLNLENGFDMSSLDTKCQHWGDSEVYEHLLGK